jgi:spore maturation protein CgeB
MTKLLLIGGSHPTAVGMSLQHAARERPDLQVQYLSTEAAYQGPRLWRALLWRLADKRPARLQWFNRQVLATIHASLPDLVLCAGNLPLTQPTVRSLNDKGARTGIYLTDDPWNPCHRNRRFMRALSEYHWRLTPRKANLPELDALAPGHCSYLPFGYEPRYFYPYSAIDAAPPPHRCELFYAGGADVDRVDIMSAVLEAGIDLHLYGDLWKRWPATRKANLGYAAPADLARLIAEAAISLCLVRRANRDGSCMKSFELPAAGACMVVERTAEHEALFGADGDAVRYFTDNASLIATTQALLERPSDRQRLRERAHQLITQGGHTYAHRLESMLQLVLKFLPEPARGP